jgi:LysM repeat protein
MSIVDDDFTIDDDGAFTGYIVIPSSDEGDYNISVTDGTYTAYANFTIGNGGESTIAVSPTHGVPGTTVTVTGVNFTQVEGSDITVSLATASVTAEVEADGTFSATLTVPSAVFTTYVVTAQDLVYSVSDTDTYKIGLMSMSLGTTSGDVGSGVIVSGVGFLNGTEYNVTMGDTLVIHNGSIDQNEYLSDTFYIPSMAAGTYTVTVNDVDNSMSASFEVTEDTSLSGSPIEVAVGQNLTLTGEGFLETDATAVTVMWANSTDSADVTGDAYTAARQLL